MSHNFVKQRGTDIFKIRPMTYYKVGDVA